MSDNLMSRRKFLAGAGLVLGAASVSGVALLKDADTAAAVGANIPWKYPSDSAAQPSAEAVARRAWEIYFKSGCAEAVWGSCVEALAAIPGANQADWASLPTNIFRFGGGGIAGWGTICGTLNGAAAFIGMAVGPNVVDGKSGWTHRNNLINGVFQYYSTTALPTNSAFKSSQGVLGSLGAWSPPTTPIANAPTSTANSPLCHSSLVQWTETTGNYDASPAQRDRCGKACFDVAFKAISMLNTYHELNSAPSVTFDPSVAACGTCHKDYTGAKMACGSCHDNTIIDGHMGDF